MGISAQEAQRRYDELGRSDWRAASLWGITLALEETLQAELTRAIRREVRARAGVRSRAGKPIAPWVVPALVEVTQAAQATQLRTGLVHALTEPPFLELTIALCQRGSIAEWFAELDATQRMTLEERVMPFVRLCLVPEFTSSLILPQRLGRVRASEVLLLGEPITTNEAVRCGLANAPVHVLARAA